MSKKLTVRFLGTFDVRCDGKTITIASRPAQSLFAYLIMHAGTSYRREKLAGLFWPDSLEETARENLRHALWRLRKALEAASSTRFLQADDVTIGFKESPDYRLDTAELKNLSENCSADELMAALSEYQGELLPGFYDEWAVLEREHLYSRFEHHMARLLALLEKEKRWLDILDWGERWIKHGQKPEPAYRALMTAHAAKGDISKVAATYQRCVKSLKEFGAEPSKETRTLYERLKANKEMFEAAIVVPARETQEEPPKTNLPIPLTSFIGREREIEQVHHLLSSTRLLTLTGTGGIGKTRLAIQIASESISKFKDGVFWVSLAGLSDENFILHEIAQALNAREGSNETLLERIKTYLKIKDSLLVIDNCEHLIQACAQYVEQFLAACPKLKVLATSIEALGLFNETSWQVPSLPVPKVQEAFLPKELQEFASINLFIERAGHTRPDFTLNEKNAKFILQICQRLDGIPLAIELAAARIKLLSVDEIAARLNDRFSLLTTGNRTSIPRHQTLRAMIDWSYDLLTPPEKILLRRLSVFAGGFTLEAAEAICGREGLKRNEVLELLGHLLDKSLVNVEQVNRGGDTHYRLLETIREYLVIQLQESNEPTLIRDEHLKYFTKWIKEVEPKLIGREQALWFSRIETEMDNLRAALDWSTFDISQNVPGETINEANPSKVAQRIELCYRLGDVLNGQAKYTEAVDLFKLMLESAQGLGDIIAQSRALQGIAHSLVEDGDYQTALKHALQAEALAGDIGARSELARALWTQGIARYRLGEAQAAFVLGEKALSLAKETKDQHQMARSLNLLGASTYILGKYDSAAYYWQEALSTFEELGDQRRAMDISNNLGVLADAKGDYESGLHHYEQARQMAHECGYRDGEIVFLCNRGVAEATLKNYKAAEADLQKTIEMAGSVGSWCLPNAYGYLAVAYLGQDKNEQALQAALQAVTLALASDTPEYIGTTWRILGVISGQMERPVPIKFKKVAQPINYSARDCFQMSEEILKANGIDSERARTLRDWAKYELKLGNKERGAEMWQEARKVFQELGAQMEVERMANLPE